MLTLDGGFNISTNNWTHLYISLSRQRVIEAWTGDVSDRPRSVILLHNVTAVIRDVIIPRW